MAYTRYTVREGPLFIYLSMANFQDKRKKTKIISKRVKVRR